MLAMYLIAMHTVSWLVGRQKTSDGFFRSGQRIGWWAAGMSIYATMLSSNTFMAIPGKRPHRSYNLYTSSGYGDSLTTERRFARGLLNPDFAMSVWNW